MSEYGATVLCFPSITTYPIKYHFSTHVSIEDMFNVNVSILVSYNVHVYIIVLCEYRFLQYETLYR